MLGDPHSNRTKQVVVGGGVLLLHGLLALIAMQVRSGPREQPPSPAPVILTTFFDAPRVALQAPQPASVQLEVPPRLQMLAPAITDIPAEETPMPIQPAQEPEAVPLPSGPVIAQADAGNSGNAPDSSGLSGGDRLVLLQRVVPVYPLDSARQGEQGVTGVILHVTQGGRVDEARLERSSGSRQLDQAALEAFRKWRFQELPAGSAPGGRWLRTEQRFVLYQFMYSRLAVGAAESVYAEHLKPKSGTVDEQTPASREALLGFVTRARTGGLTDPDAAERGRITQLREALLALGDVKAVRFVGVAGSSRWMSHEVRRDLARGAGRTVEVSWNMFEMRHERGTSEWLIATDRDGEVWAARAGRAPDAPTVSR